jgi:hypothetical protein
MKQEKGVGAMTREKLRLILLIISLSFFLGGLVTAALFFAPTMGKTPVTCTVVKSQVRSRITAGTRNTPSGRASSSAVQVSYETGGKKYTTALTLDYDAPVNSTMTGYVSPSSPEKLILKKGAGSIMSIIVFFATGLVLMVVRSRLPGFYR